MILSLHGGSCDAGCDVYSHTVTLWLNGKLKIISTPILMDPEPVQTVTVRTSEHLPC